jgi:hypothetical protein
MKLVVISNFDQKVNNYDTKIRERKELPHILFPGER